MLPDHIIEQCLAKMSIPTLLAAEIELGIDAANTWINFYSRIIDQRYWDDKSPKVGCLEYFLNECAKRNEIQAGISILKQLSLVNIGIELYLESSYGAVTDDGFICAMHDALNCIKLLTITVNDRETFLKIMANSTWKSLFIKCKLQLIFHCKQQSVKHPRQCRLRTDYFKSIKIAPSDIGLEFQTISKLIQNVNSIDHLDMSHITVAMNIPYTQTSLTAIDLSNTLLDALSIISICTSQKTLQSLNIHNTVKSNDPNAQNLAKTLVKMESLTKLDISNTEFSSTSLRLLLEKNYEILDVSDNDFGTCYQSMKLRMPKELILSRAKLLPRCIVEIFSFSLRHCTHLDLSFNHMNLDVAFACQQVLSSQTCRLEYLNLSGGAVGIGQDGCYAIVIGLCRNKSLSEINLSNQGFGSIAAYALVSVLKEHPRLQTIVLDGNIEIGDSEFEFFCDISSAVLPKILHLRDCGITKPQNFCSEVIKIYFD